MCNCVPIKLYLQKQLMGWLWPAGHSLPFPILTNHKWCLSSENCQVLPIFLASYVHTHNIYCSHSGYIAVAEEASET